MKIFSKFFVAAVEKNLTWSFNFQLPKYKHGVIVVIPKWYTILEDLFLLGSVRYCEDVTTTLKVWLIQYQDPDIRLISHFDIVMCFIYNISAVSWQYRGRCHSDIVTISECPLGTEEGKILENLTSLYGMKQLISALTHILQHSSICIDLIFFNQPNLVVDSGIHPSLYLNCHHQVIFCKHNLKIEIRDLMLVKSGIMERLKLI